MERNGHKMKEPLLDVINLGKIYGNGENITKALKNICFQVGQGEFLGIMGASGSGKTTLLNCISTIDRGTEGEIILAGRNLNSISDREGARFRRENLGFIFQDYNLLDTLTVFENIAFPLTVKKINYKEVKQRVEKIAKILGIEDILHKYPGRISGGQRQRATCARAMINEPKIILADEPTGALDSNASKILLNLLKRLNEEIGATIIMVTHDAYTASYASKIIFLKDGEIFDVCTKNDLSRIAFFDVIMRKIKKIGGEEDVI